MAPAQKTRRLLFAAGRKLVLHPAEGWLSCRLAWYVALISVSARLCSLPRTLRLISARKPIQPCDFDITDQERLARTLDLVLSANVLVFRPICWKRAAVLHRFLALNGVVTRICFGVRTEADGTVSGHAWLESNGQPVLEKELPKYVITYIFPSDQDFSIQGAAFSQ